jgi:hypothetical protein
MVETHSLRPLPKMHQADDSPLGQAIPKTPLRAVDLSQSMTALPTISSRVHAFRKLLEIRKSHRNVEPVQYMVSMWRNLLVDRPQTGIAIGENWRFELIWDWIRDGGGCRFSFTSRNRGVGGAVYSFPRINSLTSRMGRFK